MSFPRITLDTSPIRRAHHAESRPDLYLWPFVLLDSLKRTGISSIIFTFSFSLVMYPSFIQVSFYNHCLMWSVSIYVFVCLESSLTLCPLWPAISTHCFTHARARALIHAQSCVRVRVNAIRLFHHLSGPSVVQNLNPIQSQDPAAQIVFFLYLFNCWFSTIVHCNGRNPMSIRGQISIWLQWPIFIRTEEINSLIYKLLQTTCIPVADPGRGMGRAGVLGNP